VRDQRIVRNPADGVKLPRLPEAEMAFLTSGELHQLAGEVGGVDDADGLLILLLGYVGLRWGEAVALRVGRVDLMRGRLNIAEAVSDVDGHLIVGTTKNHQQRSVTVPRFLMAPLV
jgi:integrase